MCQNQDEILVLQSIRTVDITLWTSSMERRSLLNLKLCEAPSSHGPGGEDSLQAALVL